MPRKARTTKTTTRLALSFMQDGHNVVTVVIHSSQ